ncbi:MAG TPA: hypothetical protein VEZ11_00880, partial [Thermoanaerobaculia bacterium]|nr:hypothetical protein [Thermoanaerobaculia bacterium]
MKRAETYRKVGRVVRLERGEEATRLIRIEEAGQATLRGSQFFAESIDEPVEIAKIDSSRVELVASEIESMIEAPLAVERLLVSEGIAAHENRSAQGSVAWEERSERIHLAIVNRRCRVRALVDLGDFVSASREIAEVATALRALELEGRISSEESLRLHPRVTAALLAALVENVKEHSTRQGVSIRQGSHPAIRRDGKGALIEETTLIDETGVRLETWPNWYRPSYRVRPVRMPFHVRLTGSSEPQRPAIEALALLAPIEIDGGLVKLALLASESGVPFTLSVEHSTSDLMRRLRPAGDTATWYPYAAGAWGAAAVIASAMSRG